MTPAADRPLLRRCAALFAIGLAAGKRRLLEDVPALARWLPRIQWSGFLVRNPISGVAQIGPVG
jgi:hypothetical protein